MIKQIVSIAVLGAALISATGCNSGGGFQKYKGIEYKIVKEGKGRKAKIGDAIEFHLFAKMDTMVLADTRKQQNGEAVTIPVEEPRGIGEFQAAFTKLGAGDSAVIEISTDTLLKANPIPPGQQAPPWLKPGKKINVTIAVVSVKTKEEYEKYQQDKQAEAQAKQMEMQKEMEKRAAAQLPIDDKILQEYFAKNNITPTKTASGVYYTIQKPGAGPAITSGKTVSVMYTGKTLDGKAFDSNIDTNIGHHGTAPLTFPVGQRQMIPGFDEGVQLLKKGSKATLYLPSPLGYGEQGPPNIGANAILVFEVEVVDVKDAPKQDAPSTTPPPPPTR
ncbi:MAG: FKBP-type peptidyl-prolyl cis-trans isomerase [Flavipsychrobacter sp.]|jgi:FKBP-type peptidyl-prolyl cis-trans isomerase|nr:FKBP-type peptidyl-prolyl cis-trans isomerase [Flavipsychrobacter sp.]